MIEYVTTLDREIIEAFLSNGFDVDYPVTFIKISVWSLLMGAFTDLNQNKEAQEDYLKILRHVKKYEPDLRASDKLGRTCLHHAAAAGNSLGLRFTVQLAVQQKEMKKCPQA